MQILENLEEINDKKFAVVDFYTDWCNPCQQMLSTFQSFEKDWVDVYKCNAEKAPAIAWKFRIMSVPTLAYFKNWKLVKIESWVKSNDEISNIIDELWIEE